jgi:endonuclease V-like protein UPF0215 family
MKNNILIDIQFEWIKVDGLDATQKALTMLDRVKKDVIILGGVSYAGFNLIDVKRLYKESKLPIIIFSKKKPNQDSMYRAICRHFIDWKKRYNMIYDLDKMYTLNTTDGSPPVFFGVYGATHKFAETILKYSSTLCRIPEPIRTASLIAKGLTRHL